MTLDTPTGEARALCAGSNGYPAEMVIMDTVPGMDPQGTCPVCHKMLTLSPFRLPEHFEAAR